MLIRKDMKKIIDKISYALEKTFQWNKRLIMGKAMRRKWH